MKLESILSKLNSLEKNSFLKIIDNIISDTPKKHNEIDGILDESSKDLKNVDSINISKIFNLIESEFEEYITSEFVDPHSQLDIISDILIRDGRCNAKKEWFAHLYESVLPIVKKDIDSLIADLKSMGILFYSRKFNTIFVPQEIVRVLRKIRGKVHKS